MLQAKVGETPALRKEKSASRWPLAARQAEFSSVPGGSSRAGLGRNLVGRLGRMGISTMALTLLVFFAVPRYGQVTLRGSLAKPQPLVGFTDKVTLGELGKIIESREAVMQVQFFKDLSGNDALPPLDGDVYLQGAFLTYYRHGQWRAGVLSSEVGYEPLQRDRPLPLAGAVLQKITIGQLDRNELFYVTPYIAIDKLYTDITVDCPRQRLERNEHRSSHSLTYTLGTTAIVNREQLPLAPAAKTDYPITLTFVPKRDLPNLVKMAQEWIDESLLQAGPSR